MLVVWVVRPLVEVLGRVEVLESRVWEDLHMMYPYEPEFVETNNPEILAVIQKVSMTRLYWRIYHKNIEGWLESTIVMHWARSPETARERLKNALQYRNLWKG